MKRSTFLFALSALVLGSYMMVRWQVAGLWGPCEGVLVEAPLRVSESGASEVDGVMDEGESRPSVSGPEHRRAYSLLGSGFEGEIRGRVLDELSEPIAGVVVSLHQKAALDRRSEGSGQAGHLVARSRSDQKGLFDFGRQAVGEYRVLVRALGWVRTWKDVRIHETDYRSADVTLRLLAGYTLQGTVVDQTGEGVAGAWILASWRDPDSWGHKMEEVRSDEKGRFGFASLPALRTHLLAWSGGHRLELTQVDASRSDSIRIELAEVGPFKMTFSLAELPEAKLVRPEDVSVEIRLDLEDGDLLLPSPLRQFRVPAEGSIEVEGLREGTYKIEVRSDQVALWNPTDREELSEDKPELRVELGWEPGLPADGKLIYEDGSPAPDVRLEVWSSQGTERQRVKTDARGRWICPGLFRDSEEVKLALVDPGLRFPYEDTLWGLAITYVGWKNHALTVYPSPIFSGRVVDEEGRRLSGAAVWLHSASHSAGFSGETTTDERGVFRFSPAPPSKEAFFLDASHGTSFSAEPMPLQRGGRLSQEGILLKLIKGGSVEGTVVNDKGVGVPGVLVTLVNDSSGDGAARWDEPGDCITNRDGLFRIYGVPPGRFKIIPSSHGLVLRGLSPRVRLDRGERVKDLRLVMDRGRSIRGRLTTSKGKPVAGILIQAVFQGSLSKVEPGASGEEETDLDGCFVIPDLRVGEYELQVKLSYHKFERLRDEERIAEYWPSMWSDSIYKKRAHSGSKRHQWRITLPRFGRLRAKLAGDWISLPGIKVELRSGKEKWELEHPVVDGIVSLEAVPVGSYEVRFKSPWFKDLVRKVQVYGGVVSDLGILPMTEAAIVTGRVVDSDGRPVQDVLFGLDSLLGELWPTESSHHILDCFGNQLLVRSGVRGQFRVPIKGRTRIFAFKRGYVPKELDCSIPGQVTQRATQDPRPKTGAESRHTVLVLQRAGELVVQVPASTKNGQGDRWWGGLLWIEDKPRRAGQEEAKPWKRAFRLRAGEPERLISLRPGRYQLSAINYRKTTSDIKQTIPGASYYEEILIKAGTNPLILIR